MDREPDVDLIRDEDVGEAPLAPAPAPAGHAEVETKDTPRRPAAWCAWALTERVRDAAADGCLYVTSSASRAEEVGRALRQIAPDLEVLVLPPWDCLPYDRASPSRDIMGRRMAVLARLAQAPDRPRVLISPVEALLQRVPPARAFRDLWITLTNGEVLERQALEGFARRTGYVFDDRIDEPGEIALLGGVVDVFPAAASAPVRLTLDEADRIQDIRPYDPLTQRTEGSIDEVRIGPASELVQDLEGARSGAEHRMPALYGKMRTVLELCGKMPMVVDGDIEERAEAFFEHVAEAYRSRCEFGDRDGEPPLAPDALYLTSKAWRTATARRPRIELPTRPCEPAPKFAVESQPRRAFAQHVAEALEGGARVVVTGLAHERALLERALKTSLGHAPADVAEWAAVLAAGPASLLAFEADFDTGFVDPAASLVVIAAADVLGARLAARTPTSGRANGLIAEPDLRVGDVVIHEDHGLGVLTALERVEVDAAPQDALRLEYHGGADLLAPVEDFGRIWRYGAERDVVSLDRLHTEAWTRRRAELSADIDQTAEQMVALAQERAAIPGPVIKPPKAAFARLAARFPYPETPDQAAAIGDVLADLGSGQVMNRLVCGDVGFGKTEVALRAAAAVALCGKQVALVAPTTVLARQHYESLRRRFAGTEITVARLSRLAGPAELKAVKAGLADGSVQVVVGTHALVAKDVAFRDLGLLIVDEEQRFGAALKAQLRALAPNAHRLTLTATPIPRTLQLAMVGIEAVSVIATPPARRRPIRTFLGPYDPATVATALRRERRRGGQSFLVAPRISDLAPLADALARLVPELQVRTVHGELPPEELDEAMVQFAAGEGDVLLATNIIESGLDVPRANTMLVVRADLFGLAQLHQLRGRVGRGRAQGVAYLFHEAEAELPPATRARLATLEAFDRLGAGLEISARDLELRGAGDLIGEEQAGHLKLIGSALYQRLLSRAVRIAKGERLEPEWTPQLNIGVTGSIPEAYVPDATQRINLYARLARLGDPAQVDAFAEEMEDRFGPLVPEAFALLDLARLQAAAVAANIQRIDAGPKAIALTPAPGKYDAQSDDLGDLAWSGDRLIWRGDVAEGPARLTQIQDILDGLGGH